MPDASRGPRLQMTGITKHYPGGVVANNDVSLRVEPGEIHALLGENGAGKTTLMKILYGLTQPDAGTIEIDGQVEEMASPAAAMEAGVGMVHQHFMLVPNMTAIENVVLGLPVRRPPLLELTAATERLQYFEDEYGLQVEPDAVVEQLSVGQQQRLEILKALVREVKILVLDEPTAVLTPQEARQLGRIMRRLADEGRSIVFISHKLEEVENFSDRVTVLRDGQVVDSGPTAERTASALAHSMVGRPVSLERQHAPRPGGEVVLEVVDLVCGDHRHSAAVRGVSFTVGKGEIVGIAGVDGNGQTELIEAVAGLRQPDSGEIAIHGRTVDGVERNLDLVAHIPEDRQSDGLILGFSIAENWIMKSFDRPPFSFRGRLDSRAIVAAARAAIKRLHMRDVSPATPVEGLSGGNQQRVMVGRELSGDPALVIASQPSRGLDIGAVKTVHRMLLEQRERGAAILLNSTELSEVMGLSDRILVMSGGMVMGEVRPDQVTAEEIGRMMLGQRLSAS